MPPPPIPRPQKLFICSLFTLNRSLKNYQKHLKCLKLESKPSTAASDSQILSKSRLIVLQRRAKSLKVLDLQNHAQFKVSKALNFLKSCNNLSSLIIFEFLESLSSKLSLRFAPLLEYIYLDFEYLPLSSRSSEIHRSQNPIILEMKDMNNLKNVLANEQNSFSLGPLKDILSRSLSQFMLRKPSISPKPLLTKSHLHLIPSLPLFPQMCCKVSSPHKIVHFTAFTHEEFTPDDNFNRKLMEILTSLQSLRSLKLGIDSFLFVLTLSKFFQTSSKLRELSLYIPIQKQKELIELAELIGNLKNLSLLAIVNTKTIQGYASKGHRIFFTQISKLPKLKSLEINLSAESIDPLKSQFFYGCLGEFAACIEILPELQVIKFKQSEFGIAPEFDVLANALKKKGSRLEILELEFVIGEKKIDHLKKLNKAIKEMENLEKLSLKSLWTEKENLIQFCEIISELKWIKSVQLEGKNPGLEKADQIRILENILMRYGLEDLKWFGSHKIRETNDNDVEEADAIDIKQILFRNPRLHSFSLDYNRPESQSLVFKNVRGFLS